MVIRKHPKGFSAIEGILIVVFIILMIGIGWYVWYQRHQNSTTANQSTKSREVSSKPTDIENKDWKTYSSVAGKFTIKYPASWVIDECSDDDNISIFLASSQPNLAVCNSDAYGQIDIMSLSGDKSTDYQESGSESVQTKSGLKGTVLRKNNYNIGLGPDAVAAVYKKYIFVSNGRTYVFTYIQDTKRSFSDIEADFSAIVEKTFVIP